MSSVVVGYITPLIPELSDKFLYVAMRDINEQRARGEKALGSPTIDKPVWDEFYSKIKAEYERRKTMAKSYEEKAKEAIQDCYWRKNIHGVFVCARDLCTGIKVIEDGQCSTLLELFKNEQEDKSNA